MEFFNNANAVRLKSHLGKYLFADDDQETVRQTQDGASRKTRWRVELVNGNPHVIRLRSCHGRYLTASDEPFLLGMTGKKVLQASANPKRDASVEWEPIKESYSVKLRSKGGKFLRANGATPPWRNSVTYDLPYRTATQDWVMWDVDEVDVDDQYLPRLSNASSFSDSASSPNSPTVRSPATAEGLRKSIFAAERWRPSLDSGRLVRSIFSWKLEMKMAIYAVIFNLIKYNCTQQRTGRNGVLRQSESSKVAKPPREIPGRRRRRNHGPTKPERRVAERALGRRVRGRETR